MFKQFENYGHKLLRARINPSQIEMLVQHEQSILKAAACPLASVVHGICKQKSYRTCCYANNQHSHEVNMMFIVRHAINQSTWHADASKKS